MVFPVKNEYPTYELTIPSTNKKVRYRPFLAKEEKILLLAREGSLQDIQYAVKQVINNCLIDKLDVESLASFDIDYFFINLRSKSVNNIVTVSYTDREDGKSYKHEVDLNNVKVEFDPEHKNTIKINENIGIITKYPGTVLPDEILNARNEVDVLFGIIKMCLDKIWDGEEIYSFSDYSSEEINEFLDTLSIQTFNDIQKFLETLPKLKYTIKYQNSLGHERKIVLEKLSDFFTL